jgi:hypothetical protein
LLESQEVLYQQGDPHPVILVDLLGSTPVHAKIIFFTVLPCNMLNSNALRNVYQKLLYFSNPAINLMPFSYYGPSSSASTAGMVRSNENSGFEKDITRVQSKTGIERGACSRGSSKAGARCRDASSNRSGIRSVKSAH